MIVVTGVDGSDTAASAAKSAAALAAAFQGRLVVLSAFEDVVSLPEGVGDVVPLSAADIAARLAQTAIDGLRADHPDLDMTARATIGKPADALLEVAGEVNADVIVVGNKRVQGLARVLGSIANDVVKSATCDVYIAHTHDR